MNCGNVEKLEINFLYSLTSEKKITFYTEILTSKFDLRDFSLFHFRKSTANRAFVVKILVYSNLFQYNIFVRKVL